MCLNAATTAQAKALTRALTLMRSAREELKRADCPRSLERLRRTIKSAEGAERHMVRRLAP